MDDTYFTFFDNSQTSFQRYTNTPILVPVPRPSSTRALTLFMTRCCWYAGCSRLLPEHRLHRHLRPSDANWTEVPEKSSVNQDAQVLPIIWQGNMTVSNRSPSGRHESLMG
jgi:hypothetical protein